MKANMIETLPTGNTHHVNREHEHHPLYLPLISYFFLLFIKGYVLGIVGDFSRRIKVIKTTNTQKNDEHHKRAHSSLLYRFVVFSAFITHNESPFYYLLPSARSPSFQYKLDPVYERPDPLFSPFFPS